MKYIKFLFIAATISTSQLSATGVAFSLESGQLIIDSTAVTGATIDNYSLTILGFYVSGDDFSAFTNEEAFGLSGDIGATQLQSIVDTLNSYSSSTYNAFTLTPTANVDGFGLLNTIADPNNPFDSGSSGNHAVMIVLEGNSSLGGLAVGDSIGVTATSSSTLELGDFTVGFTTGAGTWDNILVGTSGSLQLASVVPEPSAFALLAGSFGMAWVMVRRRA